MNPTKRTCQNGHQFIKSSDCPVCPKCEALSKPMEGFLALLSAPARRALEKEGIQSLEDLSKWTVKDISNLHGLGPATLARLIELLRERGLTFQKTH